MVVTKTDSKKRKRDDDTVQENSKRTKVHAQRKFAQGSHMNSPVLTPVKDKDKTKNNGTAPAAELLPVKRPKTEEFVSFLCLRGSDMLPKSLEFFNEPTIPEPLDKGKRRDSSTTGTSKSNRSDKHSDQAGSVAKAEVKSKSKPKAIAAVQALKKKYQEQRLNKAKSNLTKLALKVKGKNMVRTRSSGPLDETPAPTKKSAKSDRVVTKAATSNRPQLRKQISPVKRFNPKKSRGGLRSGGDLPPGSDAGLKTERKTRKIPKVKARPAIKKAKKPVIASSLSDFSSDDEQPLAKKQRVLESKKLLTQRVTTRSAVVLKRSKPLLFRSLNTRPTRKTKEAATLFMEMLGKEDLRNQEEEEEEEEDHGVETTSVDGFTESLKPNKSEKIHKLSKGCNQKKIIYCKAEVKSSRKESQPSGLAVKPKQKDNTDKKILKKAVTTLNNLKGRNLRVHSQRVIENGSKNTRLNHSVKNKTLTRSKVCSKDDHYLSESGITCEKVPSTESVVENKRETRSGGSGQPESGKKADVKAVLQKNSPIDNVSPPSKINKNRKPTETKQDFVDSDEEPLGNKIIQSSLLSSKLPTKKTKKINEDEEPQSSKGDSNITDQLKTRKQTALSISKENSKESIIPPQLVTRRRQSLINTSSVINDCGKGESKVSLSLSGDSDKTIEKPNPIKKKLETIGKLNSFENISKKPVVKPKTLCNKTTKDTNVVAKKGSADNNSEQNKIKEDKVIVKFNKGENQNKVLQNEKKSTPSNKLIKSSEGVQKSVVKESESLELVKETLNTVVTKLPSKSSCSKEIQSIEIPEKSLQIDEKQVSKDSVKQTNKLKSKSDEKSFGTKCIKEESKHAVLADLSKTGVSNSETPADCKDAVVSGQLLDQKVVGTKSKDSSVSSNVLKKEYLSSLEDSPKTSSRLEKSVNRSPKIEKSTNLKAGNTNPSNLSERIEVVNSESKKQSNFKVETEILAPVTLELTKNLKSLVKTKDKDLAIVTANELKDETTKDKINTSGNILSEGNSKHIENIVKINKEQLKKAVTSYSANQKMSKSVNSGNQVVITDIKVPEHTITKYSNTLLTNEQPKNVSNVSKVEIKPIKKLASAELVTLSSTTTTTFRNDSKQDETKHLNINLTTPVKDKSQNNSGKEKLDTLNANVSFEDTSKLQDVVKKCSEIHLSPNKTSVAFQQSYEPPSLPKTKTPNKGMVNISSPGKNMIPVKSPTLEDIKSKVNEPISVGSKRGCSETTLDFKSVQEGFFDKAKLQGNNTLVEKTDKQFSVQVKSPLSEDIKFKFNEHKFASGKKGYSETKVDLKSVQEDFFGKAQLQGNSSLVKKPDKQFNIQGFTDVKSVIKEEQSTCETKQFVNVEDKGQINKDSCYDSKSAIESLELSDKISSAIDSLMSLQNIKKIDEKVDYVYPVSSLKNKNVDTEQKKLTVPDSECKRVENPETKRVKFLDTDLKRVTLIEPDVKRNQVQENDYRRVQFQDQKPKSLPYQVLKGCSNPKSMLKPGTLIDIAGISHSPEIMTPLRPGSDGEIIPMNRPIRGGLPDQFRMGVPGSRMPYEPRMDQTLYVPRRQSPCQSGLRPEQPADKEAVDSKSKAPVNDVWRHAFKNVKDPKSNNNVPVENPVVKKQLSLTSLAKKHNKSKTDVFGNDKNNFPNKSIPFLRQNKPASDGSASVTVSTIETVPIIPEQKKNNVEIDLSSLREKEAEFVRQYITSELVNSFTPVTTLHPPVSTSDLNQIGGSESDSVRNFTISASTYSPSNMNPVSMYTQSEQVTSVTIQLLPPNRQISTSLLPSQVQLKSSSSSVFCDDNNKRANNLLSSRNNKQILDSGLSFMDPSSVNKPTLSVNTTTDQSSQSLDIFRDNSSKRSSSPRSHTAKSNATDDSCKDISFNKINIANHQNITQGVVNPKQELTIPLSSQQLTSETVFKQIQSNKVSHASPTRNLSNQIVSGDNLFKDANTPRRTNSPTFMGSHSQHGSPINSMQSNSIKRNSNSPVAGRCSKNIFKEVVPATRSYSPTFSSASQSDDSLNNIFSQNPNFKRSISPLCNKPPFTAVSGSANVVEEHTVDQTVSSSDLKESTTKSQNSLKQSLKLIEKSYASMSSTSSVGMVTQTSASVEPLNDSSLTAEKQSFSNYQVNKMLPMDDIKTTGVYNEKYRDIKQDLQMKTNDQIDSLPDIGSSKSLNETETKYCLPLPVEQPHKTLSQTTSSPNKKSFQPLTTNSSEHKTLSNNVQKESFDQGVLCVTTPVLSNSESIAKTTNPVTCRLSTGIYSHTQEGELDLMLNKKVNMSSEEIKRWLNDGSSSLVEHNLNCGYLENNTCECEYRNVTSTRQSSGIAKNENLKKSEGLTSMSINQQQNQVSTNVNEQGTKLQATPQTSKTCEVKSSPSNRNKINSGDSGKTTKNMETAKESSKHKVVSKLESSKIKLQCDSATSMNKTDVSVVKEVCQVPLKTSTSKTPTKHSQNIEPVLEVPITPPSKKVFKLGTKHVNPERDTCLDISGVSSPPLRDDVSSSNFSSSNEETPDKSHQEKRAIFQRRSTLKVKEKKELLPPNTNAFSPENESSVYAFEPDLPPTSAPFRRSKGKDGRSINTTDDDEPAHSSSNSIAVQVNFDNEAVLECSTQTDVQEGDDDDTHTFYIPLQQNGADTTKPPLIQGVAVKLDTEGPDQKVIMRAKLVTKPLYTFNRSSSSPSRALIGPRSGKPEQKVRPLSVKPPVGTVQPTARPKPKPVPASEEKEAGPSKVCSPQAARLAKRIKNKTPLPSTSTSESQSPKVTPAKLVEAPTFYPTEKEFEDPLEYIDSITPLAEKFGLCRVVPPSNFKPECKVSDDMRFTAYNQYIHKMMHRWGPNVKEMLAIKKYLATQSIALTQPPWIGGMEVDLPRLYQTVQQCGGLMEVMEKKRWQRVADAMKIPKSAQDRVTKLDDIYCKFLLPYDTLSHVERTNLFEEVEKDWIEREKRVATSQDDDDEESDSDIDECIVKGRSMALNAFYRIARNTMAMWFSKTDSPAAADVELEFWKHVASRQHHVCVHSGSIDTGPAGYGFPTAKNSSTSRHPWNLKMLTNNPGSILRFLGPIMGVTVPTLHVGMLFSACCWYRDPHGLPWIEYLHTGASKIWYGIPDSSSTQFRSAVMSLVPRLCRDKSLWLASDTAMVPPPLLVERGVSLSRIVQEPGQFIVVFPKAYTSSVCTGYVVSESVYFAQPSWIASAQNLFSDIRDSCEPTMFSLEKLLFSIINDSRSSTEVINQILATVVSLRDGEIAGRRQLEELGLTASEQLNSKRRKSRPAADEEEDYECEKCRMSLFISYVSNSHDSSVYCLPHAVELLTHKRSQVKHCNLLYAFSEDELEDLVQKLQSRVESKNQKKTQAKGSKS